MEEKKNLPEPKNPCNGCKIREDGECECGDYSCPDWRAFVAKTDSKKNRD